MNRKPNPRSSGQALIITSLIIAMLLLSTVYYVFEVKKSVTSNETTIDSGLRAIKLSAVNTVISALANFTNGGQREVLAADLHKLSSTIRSRSYDAQCDIQSTLTSFSQYQDGMWVSWETSGTGISSACVDFAVNFSSPTTTYYSEFKTNVTTMIILAGSYSGSDTEKSVNVTYTVYNEDEAALANDTVMLYQNEADGPWTMVDSSNNLDMIDYGNGTYVMSFRVNAQDYLQVSTHVHDLRNIFVMANNTCTEA